MAQFDLHLNPSVHERAGFPFVVVIQGSHLDQLPSRLVIPLQRLAGVPQGLPRRLVQPVVVEGEALYLAAQQCAALPARLLRRPVGSLASERLTIIDALDAVISGV